MAESWWARVRRSLTRPPVSSGVFREVERQPWATTPVGSGGPVSVLAVGAPRSRFVPELAYEGPANAGYWVRPCGRCGVDNRIPDGFTLDTTHPPETRWCDTCTRDRRYRQEHTYEVRTLDLAADCGDRVSYYGQCRACDSYTSKYWDPAEVVGSHGDPGEEAASYMASVEGRP